MDINSAFIVVSNSDIVHTSRCDAEEMISAGVQDGPARIRTWDQGIMSPLL